MSSLYKKGMKHGSVYDGDPEFFYKEINKILTTYATRGAIYNIERIIAMAKKVNIEIDFNHISDEYPPFFFTAVNKIGYYPDKHQSHWHWGVKQKNKESIVVINYLIDKGCDINLKYKKHTSLHECIYKREESIYILKYLINIGCDLEIKVEWNNKNILETLCSQKSETPFLIQKIKILIEGGAIIKNICENYDTFIPPVQDFIKIYCSIWEMNEAKMKETLIHKQIFWNIDIHSQMLVVDNSNPVKIFSKQRTAIMAVLLVSIKIEKSYDRFLEDNLESDIVIPRRNNLILNRRNVIIPSLPEEIWQIIMNFVSITQYGRGKNNNKKLKSKKINGEFINLLNKILKKNNKIISDILKEENDFSKLLGLNDEYKPIDTKTTKTIKKKNIENIITDADILHWYIINIKTEELLKNKDFNKILNKLEKHILSITKKSMRKSMKKNIKSMRKSMKKNIKSMRKSMRKNIKSIKTIKKY